MTMATDDSRLSNLEGRIEEQSLAIQDLREGQRQLNADMVAGFRELSGRIDGVNGRIDGVNGRIDQINDRFDRMFLAMLGVGATLAALFIAQMVVIILRT